VLDSLSPAPFRSTSHSHPELRCGAAQVTQCCMLETHRARTQRAQSGPAPRHRRRRRCAVRAHERQQRLRGQRGADVATHLPSRQAPTTQSARLSLSLNRIKHPLRNQPACLSHSIASSTHYAISPPVSLTQSHQGEVVTRRHGRAALAAAARRRAVVQRALQRVRLGARGGNTVSNGRGGLYRIGK
jgi:hypothetical protein